MKLFGYMVTIKWSNLKEVSAKLGKIAAVLVSPYFIGRLVFVRFNLLGFPGMGRYGAYDYWMGGLAILISLVLVCLAAILLIIVLLDFFEYIVEIEEVGR